MLGDETGDEGRVQLCGRAAAFSKPAENRRGGGTRDAEAASSKEKGPDSPEADEAAG